MLYQLSYFRVVFWWCKDNRFSGICKKSNDFFLQIGCVLACGATTSFVCGGEDYVVGAPFSIASRRDPYTDFYRSTALILRISLRYRPQINLRGANEIRTNPTEGFADKNHCGRRWIRTTEGVSQQIYSLPHLATLVSARKNSARPPPKEPAASRWRDSNPRPADYKSAALAN